MPSSGPRAIEARLASLGGLRRNDGLDAVLARNPDDGAAVRRLSLSICARPCRAHAAGLRAGGVGTLAAPRGGATSPAVHRCRRCGGACERAAHCGEPAERAGGIPWLDNDGVNLAATSAGALAAAE